MMTLAPLEWPSAVGPGALGPPQVVLGPCMVAAQGASLVRVQSTHTVYQ